MATSNGQRIGIWIIAIVMTVGTLGAFFLPLIINDNQQKDLADQEKMIQDYQKQQAEQQAKSSKPLDGYNASEFDPATVTELTIEDLVVGDGTEVKADSTISANYFGWTSDGKIFDSTNKDGTTTPIEFPLTQVIPGWTKGLTGAKVGSVRKLSIPTGLAYGPDAASQGRPAGPLMFIVEVKAVK